MQLVSAMYMFCGVEYWTQRRLAALRKRKQQSQYTVEAKWAGREQEKVQKKKARCGEPSQARYNLCSLFMFDSTVVVLELWLIFDYCSTWPTRMCSVHIRTGTTRREASCACVVLVWTQFCSYDDIPQSLTQHVHMEKYSMLIKLHISTVSIPGNTVLFSHWIKCSTKYFYGDCLTYSLMLPNLFCKTSPQ